MPCWRADVLTCVLAVLACAGGIMLLSRSGVIQGCDLRLPCLLVGCLMLVLVRVRVRVLLLLLYICAGGRLADLALLLLLLRVPPIATFVLGHAGW